MIFSFPAAPDSARYLDMVQLHSGLSDGQLDWIRDYGDRLTKTDVKLYGTYNDDMVKAKGAHFAPNDDTLWLYEEMAKLVKRINGASYRFDLTGFSENFYYHTYQGDGGDHFAWHVDAGAKTPEPRKLSVVLQISDPDEYEGGEFEVRTPRGENEALKKRGIVTAFPSHKIHRVRPVTKGIRRVLVMFAAGPHFR